MSRIATQRILARPVLREAAAAVSLAVLAWPAFAQEAAPKAEKSQLETVTITAERRVENIKDVPNAVSTISGEKLDVLNSSGQDIRFLSGRVPSLNIESSFGRAFPRFYIRGYGNTDFRLNASQPVSLIYDDVVQENPILKGFPAFDLRAVEVAAGPQGSLYGRNTPAGVVKFESVKPSQKLEGYVNVSYGRFGTINAEGAANLPLTGDWAARISAQVQHRGDWVDNTSAGPTGKTEGYDDRAVRAQVLFQPHRQFSALFNVHNRELEGSPRLFRGDIIKKGTNDLVDGFDPEKMSINGRNEQKLHATGANARLQWSFNDVVLHSITAIETVQPFSRGDVDGSTNANLTIPYQSETSDALHGHRQVSQEFRAEYNPAGPLRYQAGLFFFDEKYEIESVNYDTADNGAYLNSARSHQKNRAYAVFGSVNYDMTQDFKLRGGLRLTRDSKALYTESADQALDTTYGLAGNTKDTKWTWDLAGTYALTKDTNVYARVATGFRASAMLPASAFAPMSRTNPEDTTSVEAGVKSDLWDRRARVSATVFRYETKNLQLTEVGGAAGNSNSVKTARKVIGEGVEFNLELLPVDNLFLTMGGSYNKATIRDKSLAVSGCGTEADFVTPLCTVLNPASASGGYLIDGNQLPQAPKVVYNLTARYSIPTAGGNEFYIYTDWAYRSKVNFFLYESKEFTGKALTEGGLRGGYIWANGKYEAALFVRNITNQIRVTGAIDFNNRTGFINDPRTYGVQFKAIF
ncbi:iron complex outermembrane recepter protein [Roseateles sp. YR242]|uniref:TonB-dependent receptor n=1 Tax=Roseateles sp. YR242 TaxID=1855305 RepID=UPI0008C1AB46|nr:TonB-dependent receptor [Roseateles sp. YR242]SEL27509.1 iron complex outermembrane recepter protein [Roseateles sp. YR242]